MKLGQNCMLEVLAALDKSRTIQNQTPRGPRLGFCKFQPKPWDSIIMGAPTLRCFATFYFHVCFAPQRHALLQHLNSQHWSLHTVHRTTTHAICAFSSGQLPPHPPLSHMFFHPRTFCPKVFHPQTFFPYIFFLHPYVFHPRTFDPYTTGVSPISFSPTDLWHISCFSPTDFSPICVQPHVFYPHMFWFFSPPNLSPICFSTTSFLSHKCFSPIYVVHSYVRHPLTY